MSLRLFTTKSTSLQALIVAAGYTLFTTIEHFYDVWSDVGLIESFTSDNDYIVTHIVFGIIVFLVSCYVIGRIKTPIQKMNALQREQNDMLQDLVDHLPLTITMIDEGGIIRFITDVNSGYLDEDLKRRHFINKPYQEYLNTFGQEARQFAEEFTQSKGEWMEKKFSNREGEEIYMNFIGLTTKNRNRLNIIQNVTKNRILEKKLDTQKELLLAIVDNLPQNIMLINPSGKVDFLNRSFIRTFYTLTGLDASAEVVYLGEHGMMIELCKNSPGISREELTNFIESTDSFREIPIVSRTGTLHYFDWLRVALPDGSVLSVGNNITLQRKLTKDIEAQRELLQTLIENIPLRILFVDNAGLIRFVNQNFGAVEAQQFIGRPMQDLFHTQLNNPKEEAKLIQTIQENLEWTDVNLLMPTGEIQYDSWMRVPVPGKGCIVLGQNITPRKREEKEKNRLLDMLVRRNNDLNKFSYIASHNLRGPVASVLGLVDLFNYPHTDEEKMKLVSTVGKTVKQLDSVIKDLNFVLTARHTEILKNEPVNLYRLIEDIRKALETQIQQSQVTISKVISIETVYTIYTNLYSILYSLVSNAIKFRRAGIPGEIVITVFRAGDEVVLSVKDNGKGLNLENIGKKLFMLYQRFDLEMEGKGLGLYLAKTQAEVIGGRIEVKSAPNQGSTFSLLLPASKVLF